MSLPSNNSNPSKAQASIRSFFQPKQPAYAAPPSQSQAPPAPSPPTPPPPPPPPHPPAPQSQNLPQHTNGTPPSLATVPASSLIANLPSEASIAPVLPHHIPALRRISSLLLQVAYPDSFYARLSDPASSGAFSCVILWQDPPDPRSGSKLAPSPKVIGGLVCRPELNLLTTSTEVSPTPDEQLQAEADGRGNEVGQPRSGSAPASDGGYVLYIQSLVLLSPFRSLGLAAAALEYVVNAARASPWQCHTVYAHVWTENEEGLKWYAARGFRKVEPVVQQYYYKLRPDTAWIVRKEIAGPGILDALAQATNGAKTTASIAIPATRLSPTAAAANLPSIAPEMPLAPHSTPVPIPSQDMSTAATAPFKAPPPPISTSASSTSLAPPRPSPRSGQSYQNMRAETEWNDLPADMAKNLVVPARSNGINGGGGGAGSGVESAASSRSSSTVRKKRERKYASAAFGS